MAEYLFLGGPLHGTRHEKLRPFPIVRVSETPMQIGENGTVSLAAEAPVGFTDYHPQPHFDDVGRGEIIYVPRNASRAEVLALVRAERDRRVPS